jgi:ribosomal protein S18 acetylase RimI-like enzyme
MSAVTIRAATLADAAAVASLAAATFPLACPPHSTPRDIAEHIRTRLSESVIVAELGDESIRYRLAEVSGALVGYTMLVGDVPPPDGPRGERPMELRRIYVHEEWHGHGVGAALMTDALQRADAADLLWLGTNELNNRAIRFYRRHGFEVSGSKTFRVGQAIECDYVMSRGVGGTTISTARPGVSEAP